MSKKTKYERLVQPRLAEIKRWYQDMNTSQIAEMLGISRPTLNKYISEHQELEECFNSGREELIQELKDTLKKKAKGFKYTEVKRTYRNINGVETKTVEEYEKYSPPDTGAIHLLLKNIDDSWRNDDATTIRLKEEKMQIEREKTKEEW